MIVQSLRTMTILSSLLDAFMQQVRLHSATNNSAHAATYAAATWADEVMEADNAIEVRQQ